MPKETRTSTNWKKLVLEGLAIVSSILLAFAIDAWWDDLQDRSLEEETLQGLLDEYQDHREALVRDKDQHLNFMRAVNQLVISTQGGTYQLEDYDLGFAMMSLVAPSTTDLGFGVRDGLVNSGNLDLISDDELRYQLADWEGVLDELKDDQEVGKRIVLDIVLPYLAREGILISRTRQPQNPVDHSSRRAGIFSVHPERLDQLFSDKEFRSILAIRYFYLAHALGEFEKVIAAADSILSTLKKNQEVAP